MKKNLISSAFTTVVFALLLLTACQPDTSKADEALAKAKCGSCHQYPGPSLLDKKTWESSVLPEMALMMGLPDYVAQIRTLDSNDRKQIPPAPLLTDVEYERIKAFFVQYAPDQLTIPNVAAGVETLPDWFAQEPIKLERQREIPHITSVAIDVLNGRILAGDEQNHTLWMFGKDGSPQLRLSNQPAISHIDPTPTGALVTYIGESVKPVWVPVGRADQLTIGAGTPGFTNLLTGLNRPAQIVQADLNGDGKPETISCEFGFATGGLSVWATAGGKLVKTVLDSSPGAIRAVVTDWDKDGKPDIVGQFAQGNERIVLFRNTGNLTFEPTTLLQFPPVYGSSYFELADLNGDNQPDIIYTCGDNADLSQVLKPYHGVYVYQNQGNNKFRQTFFQPMSGAYQVLARDLDGDGVLELAAIAFYADNRVKEPLTFTILRRENDTYVPYTLPINTLGRWLAMDAADLDADGDVDIVLGNHPSSPSPGLHRKEWYDGPSLLILRNKNGRIQ